MNEKPNRKIKQEKVSDIVYEMMYDRILSGAWASGDKIPNEFELCDTFGASRISVRNAIQRLVSIGMLEVKRGDGTYVKTFSLQNYLQQAVPFMVKSEDRKEIAQFREALEAQSCRLAIEIHNDEEIDELERLFYISNEAFHAQDVAAYVTCDLNYHRHLCIMSHNKIIVTLWDAFVKPLSISIQKNVSPLLEMGTYVDDHHLYLAQAIRAKDIGQALTHLHCVLYGNEISRESRS